MDDDKLLGGTYPYALSAKFTDGQPQKYAVILPPTADLLLSVGKDPEGTVEFYRKLFPENVSLLIIGYDPLLPPDHKIEWVISDFAKIFTSDQLKEIAPGFQLPVVVAGFSYGGKIAMPFAAAYPELVSELIILMSAHKLSKEGVIFCRECIELARVNELLQLRIKFTELFYWKFAQIIAAQYEKLRWPKIRNKLNNGTTLVHAYEHMLANNDQTKNILKDIRAKTLVIGASQDLLFTEEVYRQTAKLIPNGMVAILNGFGHMAPLFRARRCRRLISEYIF